jgi:hypothetical protein
LVGILVTAYLVLQLPAVQKALLDRYLAKFKQVTHFDISTTRLHLYWYDRLEVNGLKVLDPESNEMIYVNQLLVNFQVVQLQKNSEVNIDGVTLDSARVNLVFIPESDTSKDININEFITAINKMFAPPAGSVPKSPKINIGEVLLTNSLFSYHNPDKDSVESGFDHNHFKVWLDDSDLSAFKVIGDTIQFDLRSFMATEIDHSWPISQLKTFFRFSQGGMEFLNFNLKAGKSVVGDTITMKYNGVKDLSDFVNSVSLKAKLENCLIHPDDIAFFAKQTGGLPHPITISGYAYGRIKHFYFEDMDVQLGSSRISGNLEMDGLPSIKETFMNLKVSPSTIDIDDLKFALPIFGYEKLKPLKRFRITGDYIGFFDDFVADGKIVSSIGVIDSDINLKIDEDNLARSSYIGNLSLTDFHLGEYLEDTVTFQRITMNGNIAGVGLTASTADFAMKGKIDSVGILDYEYVNIVSNARFTRNFFEGSLSIHDPNLNGSAIGSLDFRNKANLIDLTAKIDTANLRALKLISQDFSFHSEVTINSKGLHIDSLQGRAKLTNLNLRYKENSLALDSVEIISAIEGSRSLNLKSSFGSLQLYGDFYYSTMFKDIRNIFTEFQLNIRNEKATLADYYSRKQTWSQEYKADFRAQVNDINPVLEFLKLDIGTSKNFQVEGDFTNGFTSIFHTYTSVNTIRVADKYFYDNQIEFNGSKIHDTTSVLALLTFTSKRQQVTKSISTKDLLFEAIWNRDHIDVGFDFDQEGYDNSLRLVAEVDFLQDSTRIRILPSIVRAFGQDWSVNPKNSIMFKGKEWAIDQFEIRYKDEMNMLQGRISEDPGNKLQLLVKNLGIDLVNSLTSEKFDGTLNADFSFQNLYGDFTFQSEFSIDNLSINKFLVGDVSGSSTWDPDLDAFIINFFVDYLQSRVVDITGLYNPSDKEQSMNLTARFNKTNIKIIEPIMRGLFSNWDGTATGQFDIKGTIAKPDISGQALIEKGRVTVDYLKTTYGLTGKIALNHNQIQLQNINLTDGLGNKGNVEGIIAHRDFAKFRINLDGNFNNFQLLNTTMKDNSLFYGQAYGTGSLNIFGPFENLKISATARTEKNTRMFIPISGSTNVVKSDFISFVSFRDTTQKKDEETMQRKRNSNFSMSLNLDITPDAYAEIIFDLKAGDIIRGYGRGDIKLDLDTKGEFNMFGLYEFERGFYNFTLGGVINKEFAINKGSRISWFGDPYAGVVNISASYRQLASIAPILSDQSLATSPQLRRKFPIEVLLKLDGPMLGPQIGFDLAARDLPENITVEGRAAPVRPNFEFNAFKARLDEQELKKQVFSLIVLRRFSPPDAFTTSGGIANSVSEFLSNQLSYWLSQVDQNLEVNIDLGTLDQEAFNTFQLRMSYSFLNGRLRITRDGSLSSNQFAQSEVAAIAGDWTVDYLLTPDGKFKAKMYSRSNYNALLNSIGTQSAVTTGISLSHTQNFNEFADLIRSARRKRQESQPVLPEPDEEDMEKGN